jgi:hypothetical protein
MTLTVRLNAPLEQELAAHCRRERMSKSEVINRLLKSFLEQQRPAHSFYEAAKASGLFGCVEGGPDLSVNRKKHLRARYLKKRAR